MHDQSLKTLKKQLAAAIRMMEKEKHIDFNGHMSARVPKTDFILINSASASRSSLTEEDIIMTDLKGAVVEGEGRPPNEIPLHTRIYNQRTDVQSIAHTHPRWSTLFTIANIPLRPVIMQGAVLGEIPVFSKSKSISDHTIADELAEKLSEHHIILLKAHGAVITGSTIVETFVKSIFLEENANRQYMASQMGYAQSLEIEEIHHSAQFIWKSNNIQKVWDYYYSHLSLT
ncbi:class II aldolase/adducin family protein [Domibacillus epiphyticus]|uniref:Class II aldolase/adducin N-terminal domain-containing protein n=1 Tax=Domibacillus epiphyticus TaxID=1714355 RepID=A0A1V2A7S1_9BACI|nr:class II aldolase/adducin family protein [Domibacillus epiphyticus]OMP66864.1 hypothetical protein BTO28_09635 [Domibacillus epiphyticus]